MDVVGLEPECSLVNYPRQLDLDSELHLQARWIMISSCRFEGEAEDEGEYKGVDRIEDPC